MSTPVYIDVSLGPNITGTELRSGQFQINCDCGYFAVTNPKYSLTKEDLITLINCHITSAHSDIYGQ